jgi:hypothetical protein
MLVRGGREIYEGKLGALGQENRRQENGKNLLKGVDKGG